MPEKEYDCLCGKEYQKTCKDECLKCHYKCVKGKYEPEVEEIELGIEIDEIENEAEDELVFNPFNYWKTK